MGRAVMYIASVFSQLERAAFDGQHGVMCYNRTDQSKGKHHLKGPKKRTKEEDEAFEGLDYRYDETYSDAQTYVFVRRKKEKLPEFE